MGTELVEVLRLKIQAEKEAREEERRERKQMEKERQEMAQVEEQHKQAEAAKIRAYRGKKRLRQHTAGSTRQTGNKLRPCNDSMRQLSAIAQEVMQTRDFTKGSVQLKLLCDAARQSHL